MKVFAITTVLALAASTGVHAHGGLVDPAPRALTTMKLAIESTFGHPIPMRASYTNGKGGNCLDFTADTNLQPLATGKTKLKMRANSGANHVGMCTAYLVDPRDKTKKVQVGRMKDCMRSLHPGPGSQGQAPIPAEMTIDVPSADKLPCNNGHCVLEWYWEASHISPHELYNNCADVKVSGGGSNPNPAPGPAPGPAPTTAPKPNPAPAPAPAPGSGKYQYIGSHPHKAGLTQWCNLNCPHFCPEDMCKAI
jgi:hypothetical protein